MNLLSSLVEARDCLDSFLQEEDLNQKLSESVSLLVQAFREGKNVLSCGNGGSACDAMHFAEEFSGRYRKDRKALPALALTDPSYLTCVANDFGYDQVFARGVEAFGAENGVLLAISTSGNSANVLNAAQTALSKGMKVIGLTGRDGGKLKENCSPCFIVPGTTTDRIQEIHIKLIHTMIEGVERELFPENYQ